MLELKDTALLRDRAYVDGAWIAADAGGSFPVESPANGEILARVADCGAAETRRAIEAADAAWPAWRAKSAKERAAILRVWYDLIVAAADDLGALMTAEQGKVFAEEAKRVYGDTIPAPTPDKRFIAIKQPIGVVAAITPWNFPSSMITRKVSPALAAGCTVVIKPAKATPLSALALAVLAERAGIPQGVFNVIVGSKSGPIGDELATNPIVRKLSFTGSTEVGKILLAKTASTVKKVSMELGGNAPFIVFDDADLDAAVIGAIASKYRNSGQTCVCANRILVQDGVYDAFAAKFKVAVEKLKVGDGMGAGVTQGPMIDVAATEKVAELVADAVAKGGKVEVGGKPHALGRSFYEPTVITGATAEMRFTREEIFGPVAPLYRFKTEAEAIALANDTNYGLASYFYSRDVGRIFRVMEALEYGMVGVNEGLLANEAVPFGGIKESGLGREGSKYGIEDFLEIKYACLGGI